MAFKWGGIFGVVAGVVNLVQVLLSVAAVNANLNGINSYENSAAFQQYLSCLNAGNSSACQLPQDGSAPLGAVIGAFYGSCIVIFLLTFVAYILAARFAAKEAQRRGPGIWAAIIAAVVGSLLYLIAGIVAISATGRSGLLAGFGPFSPLLTTGDWASALIKFTVIVDVIAMLITAGVAALLGLGGAALGLRGLPPAGYPMLPYPTGYGPAPYGPTLPMYAPPGMSPGMPNAMPNAMPNGPREAPPAPPPAPDYTLPEQYPPLPSHYEAPAAGQDPGASTGTPGPTGTSTDTADTGNA